MPSVYISIGWVILGLINNEASIHDIRTILEVTTSNTSSLIRENYRMLVSSYFRLYAIKAERSTWVD